MAKYKQVKREIKSWILEGEVRPGERIKSENALVDLFGVSRTTVRQAIGELVNEGWLYREQGRGTFCADPSQRSSNDDTRTIGVITTYISHYIFPSIIRGIESHLTERGYSTLIASTNNNIAKEEKCLQKILSQKISGLIIDPTKGASFNPNLNYYLTLEKRQIPYVMINGRYEGLNAPSLVFDDTAAGYMATEHLLELGHRKIAGIFKIDDLQGVKRMKGFFRAHRLFGSSVPPGFVASFTTENESEQPRLEAERLLQNRDDRPTAFVCYNDQSALDVLHVIREKGLRIPEDVSIVGIDDSHLAEASEIKLTTIRHPKMKLGRDAATMILELVEGKKKKADIESVVYEPELVLRHSTAAGVETAADV